MRSWIGEKVVFLTDPSPFSDKNFPMFVALGRRLERDTPVPNEYAGKVGTVTDTLNDATELVVIVEPSAQESDRGYAAKWRFLALRANLRPPAFWSKPPSGAEALSVS